MREKNKGTFCRIAAGLVRAWWPGAGLVAWCGPGGLVRAWWPGGLIFQVPQTFRPGELMMPQKTANDPPRWPIFLVSTNRCRCIDCMGAHMVRADKNPQNGAD